jgi:glycosyltransferase involved in cell wall biosynthesis
LLLFLTLKTFSATGGVEKVCRVAGKAFMEYSSGKEEPLQIISLYDAAGSDPQPYFPTSVFRGLGAKRISFVIQAWRRGIKSRVVVLSHVNLLMPGYLIKIFSPQTKLILIAHGIEVWRPFPFLKRRFLKKVDLIVPVSSFTRDKMKSLFHLPDKKFRVINNCLDPFLAPPADGKARIEWRKEFQIADADMVLMTLSRLSVSERTKGYDKVLYAIRDLKTDLPFITYLFVGKYEEAEKNRLENLARELGLEGRLIFTGFVRDQELSFYYNMADIYIMPSEKEGFGISFIEAMYYGLPVIAGNRDGTKDALLNGRLGTLIDPESQEEITGAIRKLAVNLYAFRPDRELLQRNFNFSLYKKAWGSVLDWKVPDA